MIARVRGRHVTVQMMEKGERDLWAVSSVYEGSTEGRLTMRVEKDGKATLHRGVRPWIRRFPIRGL